MAEDVKEKSAFPLGEIVAKRRFTLYDQSGAALQVIVQIGKPVPVSSHGDHFRCPLSITGLGLDSRVFPPSGEDSLMALQHAIGLAGQVIDEAVRRLNLINPLHEVRERHRAVNTAMPPVTPIGFTGMIRDPTRTTVSGKIARSFGSGEVTGKSSLQVVRRF